MLHDILKLVDQVPVTADWKTKVTRSDGVDLDPMPGFDAMFTFRIEPKGAKLKKVIDQMAQESPKYRKIFGNLPTSRSKLLRILTDRQPGESIDLANAKAAAIKAFYRAQKPLLDQIEESLKTNYPGKAFIFNPIEFKYSGAGDTVWEAYVYSESDKPAELPEPIELPVETTPEDLVVAPEPRQPKAEDPDELIKVEKHILSREEIDAIIDGIVVKLGLNPNTDLTVVNDAATALNEYEDMRYSSVLPRIPTVVVSDSYNTRNPRKETYKDGTEMIHIVRKLPNVVAYIQTTKGREVKSRDEWNKLMQGRQPTGELTSTDIPLKSTKLSRYGAPIAKVIRKAQQETRTYDEIAVYADIKPAINKFSGKARKWGGEVRYTFFIIVPKETYVPRSKLKTKRKSK
tara:strand:+ start:2274 stop:3479 length:1206 start_codon:yes stop_codon:yes gene_type:complete